jgi:hypothetical protein
MPLVGHGSPVIDNPHHEPKCDLLGPHGSGSQWVFAENAELGPGMQEELDHDTDDPDIISTECHTSKNNIYPSSPRSPSGSHRSLLNHQRRHSLQEHKFVSITIVVSLAPPRACQPRLIIGPHSQAQLNSIVIVVSLTILTMRATN